MIAEWLFTKPFSYATKKNGVAKRSQLRFAVAIWDSHFESGIGVDSMGHRKHLPHFILFEGNGIILIVGMTHNYVKIRGPYSII